MFKVMVVEDEPIIREGLKHYFDWNALQFQSIIEASNGLEGLELARVEKPDLIITDIRMPILSGLDMIERLRGDLPNSMFVILTGYNDFEYAQRAIKIGGVYEYLVKPLQYDTSLSVIERCREQLLTRIPSPQSDQETPILDFDDELFQKIEQFILQHIDQDLSLPVIAEKFYYNSSYLSRLFKQKLNKSFSTFHTEIRINYAKERLSDPEFLVTDVCTMCGYKSYKHFVKTFKQMTKMTPSEYRKRLGFS